MNDQQPKSRNRTDYLICFALVLATLAVYWQVYRFGFVLLDDPGYVSGNAKVLGGLSAGSILWAFRAMYQSNWHPLTWISLMADAQIGGGSPLVFHLTNVVLHVANVLLLFAFLRLATGSRWRSAFVALLFAIHPLHVESVAWVTERKDVLSTLFWLLTMLAYLRYTTRPSVLRYVSVAVLFALGLMAKPMLVTLPFVLLLMDIWPLGRVGKTSVRLLIAEKIPLLVLTVGSCVLTMIAQSSAGAVYTAAALPIGARISNALVACVGYIVKMFWPANLMPQYPHPGRSLPEWKIAVSAVLLAAATIGAIASARKRSYVAVGWAWYLLTLVPVIGLVQVGLQAMADRYTYVPLIGLFIIIAWGVPEIVSALGMRRPMIVLAPVSAALTVALMVSAHCQTSYWRSTEALGEHSVRVSDRSYTAHLMLGDAYAERNRCDKAAREYLRARELAPFSVQASFDLAQIYSRMNRYADSANEFRRTLKFWGYRGDVHYQAGVLLAKMGQYDRAIGHFRRAPGLGYDVPRVYVDMGCAYIHKHDLLQARDCFNQALRLDPKDPTALRDMAWVEQQLGDAQDN